MAIASLAAKPINIMVAATPTNKKRSVPDVHATEQDIPSHTGTSRPTMPLLCGIGRCIGATGRLIMNTLATAMRGAHVADFYMTKYASKAQQALVG